MSDEGKTIIRPIHADELPQLLALYHHLHATDAPLPENDELTALWQQIMANQYLHYFVAEVDGKLVASCTLTIVPNLTRGARPYGLIENVVTDAAYRRRGLGRQVLHAALEKAWQEHCYKVMLLTGSKKEETLRFYEESGFKRGVKTGFVAMPGE